ncbi:MAG: hypothetical protein NUV80_04595 [Candidatus Berkelbacteria bacterium]|nr:hypothetical protein [Candidatus Berkelbacteria bacterium]
MNNIQMDVVSDVCGELEEKVEDLQNLTGAINHGATDFEANKEQLLFLLEQIQLSAGKAVDALK